VIERDTVNEVGLCGIELPGVVGELRPFVSRHCAAGLHGFCTVGKTGGCRCTGCHLGPCTRCGRDDLQKTFAGGTLCADCYRDRCHATPHQGTRCDRCNAEGAFRNPGTRRNEYLCTACHAAAGEPLALTSSVQGLVAACHGADVSDPRHEWAHVKGNTFGCVRCKVKSYQPDLRKAMRRGDLGG
jgi:hypothetical protein